MTPPSPLIIGQVARASGVPAKTIRYYEQIGLITPAARAANGYRLYDPDTVEVLRFIRRARALDFSLPEVTELLGLWRAPDRSAGEVRALAQRHLDRLEQKRIELEQLQASIRHLVDHCHGDDRPDCPIIDELAGR
jgi:MerR family copper efflux transcriptional regulator